MRELPEIPDGLWRDLADAPHVPEDQIDVYVRAGGRVHGDSRAIPLDEDEKMVLRAYAAGLEGPMTAETLGISYEQVRWYMMSARKKLSAKNATNAVAEAIRRGLIQ